MGEAIFSKYPKSKAGETVSNATKAMLGLSNGANLDDCIRMLSLRGDSTHGTIQVTLKDVDGEPLGEHKIKMVDSDNKELIYTTDGAGQCLFKTTAGQATFSEDYTVNNGWFDIGPGDAKSVDCPVGTVKMVELQRKKTLSNGWGATITTNQWMNFSKFADKLNVTVRGGSGQGGSSGFNWISSEKTTKVYFGFQNNRSSLSNPFWQRKINDSHFTYMYGPRNCVQSGITTALNSGGNGAVGNVNNGNDIDISNQNFKLTFPTVYSKNYNIYRGVIESTQINRDDRYDGSLSLAVKGSSGSTGGSTSAFGISASGGRGGGGGGTDANKTGPSYGSGSMSGYGGSQVNGFINVAVGRAGSIGFYLQCGNSCPGQVVISNFRYK